MEWTRDIIEIITEEISEKKPNHPFSTSMEWTRDIIEITLQKSFFH